MTDRLPRLGIDVGQVRVGVAFSDPDGLLASPWKTLKRDPKKNSDLRVLVRFIVENNVGTVYVGLPRSLRGNHTESTLMAESFAIALAQDLASERVVVDVRLIDERLTTVSAHRDLHAAGVEGRSHRKIVDQVAAVAILQQALEMEKTLRGPAGSAVDRPARQSTEEH
ncbi:Holliday junction resolvase RuvX [Zhihengliuella flava]|uniref:Putative pre-16S rRNA nuclease n=1 Tax=Zhihengliuella flava TaxID=1285193 RepID=A0A931DB29_9MICC|nr:Holliday junction resolvase RuvX [Zhihengliuella flava]MBG6083445.1 putative Holliday junction resolvase [Zhihengliuella flava]